MKVAVLYPLDAKKWASAIFDAPIQDGQDIRREVAFYWNDHTDDTRPTSYLGLEIEDVDKALEFACHYALLKKCRLFRIDVLGLAEEIKIPADIIKEVRIGEANMRKRFGED